MAAIVVMNGLLSIAAAVLECVPQPIGLGLSDHPTR
jgi:hypothetical protein